MIYFAFGSNMNLRQMGERCRESRFISSGVLKGFRFVYDGTSERWGGAVGNIIPSDAESVQGALFEVTDSDLAALDRYEGYPERYQKIEVQVEATGVLIAFAYYREGEIEGMPSESYQATVVEGARNCGLSEDYISKYLVRI